MSRARIVEWIVLACLVAGAAIYVSGLIVQRNLARADAAVQKTAAEKAKARAAGFESALASCLSGAKEQNTQVLALKAERDRLQDQHAADKAKAAKEAKPHYGRAAELGGMKPPPGQDACTWARDLVDDALRQERGR